MDLENLLPLSIHIFLWKIRKQFHVYRVKMYAVISVLRSAVENNMQVMLCLFYCLRMLYVQSSFRATITQ